MSRYTPVGSTPVSPTHSRRSSLHSLRRPSFSSSFRFGRQQSRMPDPDEMDAAFDAPPDADEDENSGLLGSNTHASRQVEERPRIPGDYNFDDAPPPFQDYSSHNPAPGNTNGILPSETVRPPVHSRHFLGGILPSALLPRQASPSPHGRVMGAGNSGIFTNLAARPTTEAAVQRQDGPEYAPEDEQKDGPPSYQAALRDAVPTYWDTTVVLPSNNSPFGPLTSSLSGDEILIDGMPSGNFFGFFWNMIVSFSFQFVGFLLTYVLHTTHAAKYGSRVGLGFTLIQFGFNLRARAEELIETGKFPSDPSDPEPYPGANQDEVEADNAIAAFWGSNSPWPQPVRDPDQPDAPPTILHNTHEAELWAIQHNTTLHDLMRLPSAEEVGKANEWFSFLLMSIGWFLVLTSLGGLWRVKRFERGLRDAQRVSEAAQAAANGGTDEAITTATTEPTAASTNGPTTLAYYTSAFNQAFEGARGIQRGFFGMNGRRQRGGGHAPLPQDEDVELFDADHFERPMAAGAGAEAASRQRGLWG